jgi:hypothetical protein
VHQVVDPPASQIQLIHGQWFVERGHWIVAPLQQTGI